MSLDIPTRFPLLQALGAAKIREIQPITQTAGEFLRDACHWLYANGGRRDLLPWASEYGLGVFSGLSYEERWRVRAWLGEGRRYVTVAVEADGVTARVSLLTTGGTSLDSDTIAFSAGSRTRSTIALDAGTAGIEVQVVVETKQTSLSADGYLYAISALEDAIPNGTDLPMQSAEAFGRIGSRLVERGQPISAHVAQRLAASCRAARVTRGRQSVIAYDQRNPPRWCGMQRVVVPLLWAQSESFRDLEVQVGARVHLGARIGLILRPADAADEPPVGEMADYEDVADTSGAVQVVTLSVSLSGSAPGTLSGLPGQELVLCLCIESERGAEVLLEGATTADGDGWLTGWSDGVVRFSEAPVGSPAPFGSGSEIPTAAIRFGALEYKIAGDPMSGTQEPDEEAYRGALTLPPPPAQVVRVDQATGHRLYMWEVSGSGTFMNSVTGAGRWNVAYWIPLGYVEPLWVRVRETNPRTLNTWGSRLNAGAEIVAGMWRSMYMECYLGVQKQGRVLAAGVTPDPWNPQAFLGDSTSWWGGDDLTHPTNVGIRSSDYTEEAIYIAGTVVGGVDSKPGGGVATWGRIAWATLSDAEQYEDDDAEQLLRDDARAVAMVRLTGSERRPDAEYELRVRLVAEDAATLDNAVAGDEGDEDTNRGFEVLRAKPGPAVFPGLHALCGVVPASSWRNWGLKIVRLTLEDATLAASGGSAARRVALEAQASDRPVGDGGPDTWPYRAIECMGWLCYQPEIQVIR